MTATATRSRTYGDVTVTWRDGRVYVQAPYNHRWRVDARDAGGKWDPEMKAWHFPEGHLPYVAKLIDRAFAIPAEVWNEEPGEPVTVALTIDKDYDQQVWFAGRKIMERPFRDASVRLHPEVSFEGELPPRGGSRNYPKIGHVKGTLRTVLPRNLAERLAENSDRITIEEV